MDDTKKIEYKLIPNKETLDLFLKKNFKKIKLKKFYLLTLLMGMRIYLIGKLLMLEDTQIIRHMV